ncbi:Transcriptional regulatory protein YpdB [Caprobacter fermentans]|uniref:Stage 0 sporulation protein A homolog n=1 Tax=Caproicibacter fermentans TaxID=2576756 RepID=A0A6N8HWV1_9FIRM|nr:LytTR family DNA-binding domain-containing protein [Caproicibacter fermentans]MVB10138.1 Transcriptional regulatory protein YpdB [Caproicibacter fermentans]
MLEIAVCDDDKNEIDLLKAMIYQHCHEICMQVIISTYQDGHDLINSTKKFHAIFLDIQMDTMNGIETAKVLRKTDKQVKIIFVTNYNNYQCEAFSVRAFGYVIKPVSFKQVSEQLNDVIEYSTKGTDKTIFTFSTDKGFRTCEADKIFYFESANHKIRMVYDNDIFILTDSIINVYNKLKPYGFSMPHKSFVINLLHISKIQGYDVLMTNGSIIPMSQKRAVEFKSEFHSYLKLNFNLIQKR